VDSVNLNIVGIASECKCADPDSKQCGVKWAEHREEDSDGVLSASLLILTSHWRRCSSCNGNLRETDYQ